MSTCTPCGQSCIVAKMFVRFQEYERNFHENWLSRPHPTHTASVASSCCLELFFKERKKNSKFHQRRLVELRDALLSPSAVIKKCCQWCSACVTTLEELSAQCPKALESAEWNTSSHQIGRPTKRPSLSMKKKKRNKNCVSDSLTSFFLSPTLFAKRKMYGMHRCPGPRKV